MTSKVVQECRGLLVDEENNYRVISFPYTKFFNYNETCAVKIDWKSAKVYDKLDGSLAIMYHYKGKWYVASSSKPEGGGTILKANR